MLSLPARTRARRAVTMPLSPRPAPPRPSPPKEPFLERPKSQMVYCSPTIFTTPTPPLSTHLPFTHPCRLKSDQRGPVSRPEKDDLLTGKQKIPCPCAYKHTLRIRQKTVFTYAFTACRLPAGDPSLGSEKLSAFTRTSHAFLDACSRLVRAVHGGSQGSDAVLQACARRGGGGGGGGGREGRVCSVSCTHRGGIQWNE